MLPHARARKAHPSVESARGHSGRLGAREVQPAALVGSGVRREGQGAELDDLSPEERVANAAADERGGLHLASAEAT